MKPYLDTLNRNASVTLIPDYTPKLKEPDSHRCNVQGEISFTKDDGLKAVNDFCESKTKNGDDWLRYRKSGTTDDMTNAVIAYYPILFLLGTNYATIRIYAFVDNADDCTKQFPNGMRMDRQSCLDGLSFLVNKCKVSRV